MSFILFVMFFVSPPAEKGKQVWALHSSNQMEFETMDACKTFGTHLQGRMASTDTVAMRGWCVSKVTGAGTFSATDPRANATDKDFFEIPSNVKLPR